jgi:folate-binding Fe-S cluster repair protein YgfZ
MPTHISLTKGCYVGQEIVARIDSRGHTNRALTGLLVLGETLPVAGEKLFAEDMFGDGKEVGWVTSVAPISPAAGGRPIALAYVRHEQRSTGAWLRIGSADSGRRAEVADLPFYRKPAS